MKTFTRLPMDKEKLKQIAQAIKAKKVPKCPPSIESLEQWEQYQKWEDYQSTLEAKKRSTDEQPLNYNHTNPFDELDKSLGNNPDSTSGKDKKKNRFEHLEIETDGTDNSKGDSGAPAK